METLAVLFDKPESVGLRSVVLEDPPDDALVVETEWSGISTGTERLLFTGRMPPFPGLGYPLVPGYESVGRVVRAPRGGAYREGERVFVPGATCYRDVRGLFGGAAARLICDPGRARRLDPRVAAFADAHAEQGVLLALAATAWHALAPGRGDSHEARDVLIVGHGVLGRLLARLVVADGDRATVWEKNEVRLDGAEHYRVCHPEDDTERTYSVIYDVTGDASVIEPLIRRLSRGGELVLAGFYAKPIQFDFPWAFMKEARLRVAAEWAPEDLDTVIAMLSEERFALHGLITHRRRPDQVTDAYRTAFADSACLKMLIDWRKEA